MIFRPYRPHNAPAETVPNKLDAWWSAVEATCVAIRVRPGKGRYAIRYRFEFRDESVRCYDGDQTAFWFRTSSA